MPYCNRQINFSAKGAGKYRAAANGDPTNLEQFHLPKMHAFNGMLTAIIQAGETAGEIVFTAKANGVKARKYSYSNEIRHTLYNI